MWSPSGPIRRDQQADLRPRADHGPLSGHWFGACSSSQRPRAPADDAGELSDAAGLDGSSVARRDPWSDPAGLGVDSRSASGLCRVVAGDDRPFRPPVPPSGGPVRPPESRGSASGREQAARTALEPSGIRALALSLTASEPSLS